MNFLRTMIENLKSILLAWTGADETYLLARKINQFLMDKEQEMMEWMDGLNKRKYKYVKENYTIEVTALKDVDTNNACGKERIATIKFSMETTPGLKAVLDETDYRKYDSDPSTFNEHYVEIEEGKEGMLDIRVIFRLYHKPEIHTDPQECCILFDHYECEECSEYERCLAKFEGNPFPEDCKEDINEEDSRCNTCEYYDECLHERHGKG